MNKKTSQRLDDAGLLDALQESIIDSGLRRLSIAQIARTAGVSRPTLYRRWSAIDDMFADLVVREIGTFYEKNQLVPDGLESGVAALVDMCFALYEHPVAVAIRSHDPGLLESYFNTRPTEAQSRIVVWIRGMIQIEQRSGNIRPGDPEHLAAMCFMTAQAVVFCTGAFNHIIGVEDMRNQMIDTIVRHLRASDSPDVMIGSDIPMARVGFDSPGV